MLRLSKLTDYAVVVLVHLADADGVQSSTGIATATGVPEPTVSKVLKILAGQQIVVSQRGAHGGYRLGRSLAQLSVAEVIAAIDGPIALAACVEGSATNCDASDRCLMRGRWNAVNEAILGALSGISLADMAAPRLIVPPPYPAALPVLAALAE